MVPSRSAIPSKCHFLLEWYEREYAPRRTLGPAADPLLAPRGSDRELWAEEHAGEYVRRLREGWDLFDFTPGR